MEELDVGILRELLDCDELTGALRWKAREARWFSREPDCRTWNTKFSGKEVTCVDKITGYIKVGVLGKNYQAHRICYAIHYGVWPENQIDHINGIRDDNRILNLRDVSNQENSKNQKKYSSNTSGVIGVVWNKASSKWRANIKVGGKTKHLGCFEDKQEAIAARRQAELDYSFHKNHGRN